VIISLFFELLNKTGFLWFVYEEDAVCDDPILFCSPPYANPE